ncbi:transcriptional regulator ToxR, partial [Vibrio parahaemolyticus]|nr:transcriptional regulator ToxR [Vibrio parahaemolyticus]
SSLTQAISTLRKMLKDSTKSPEFVKTVPKRGYQLICTVERLSPLSSDSSSIEVEEPASDNNDASANEVETIVEPSLTTSSDAIVEPEAPVVPEKAPVASAVNPWIPRVILFLALLLPICVLLFTNPAESQFRQIGEYQNVPVMTPVNHPQINNWLPSIEQCIERYVKHHAEDSLPVEVIATGGQNNQLILNYIHDSNHSYENVTLRIFAGQNDPTDICK